MSGKNENKRRQEQQNDGGNDVLPTTNKLKDQLLHKAVAWESEKWWDVRECHAPRQKTQSPSVKHQLSDKDIVQTFLV